MTLAGIEPATFRFVAQHLNHRATAVTGVCMCGCFDNYVGVVVICVLVFTMFCIVCTVFLYCFVHVYLFLFFTALTLTLLTEENMVSS